METSYVEMHSAEGLLTMHKLILMEAELTIKIIYGFHKTDKSNFSIFTRVCEEVDYPEESEYFKLISLRIAYTYFPDPSFSHPLL